MNNLREELYNYKAEFGLLKTDMTQEEIRELFLFRQMKILNTIKNCVIFFVTLTVISMIISLIGFIMT